MSLAKTKDLVSNLRKDAVVSAMIPPTLCPSQPIPIFRNGTPCLGFYFYGIVGRTSEYSLLSAPQYRIVIEKETGRIVEAMNGLSFLPSNFDIQKPVARFPGKGLTGKTTEEQDVLYDKYYELCDRILDSQVPFDQSPVYHDWKNAFETVCEDGFEKWYQDFLNSSNSKDAVKQSPTLTGVNKHRSDTVPQKEKHTETLDSSQSLSHERKITLPIQQYFNSVEDLVTHTKCNNLETQLKTVRQMKVRNDFRIAVIGEFSRGKSYFLNKLLDIELLAQGVLPTTAIITQIENGKQPNLVYIASNNKPQKLDVTPESFERFIADDNGKDPAGVLLFQTPIEWFNGRNIKLYDTPGAGDLFGKRAELTLEAIQTCDAVIMTITAPMACSMTEMAFLHDNVVLKATPKISVLITKLDLIAPNERQKVVEYIQQKIRSETKEAKFWTLLTPPDLSKETEQLFDAVGVSEIRKSIVDIVNDKDLLRLRSVQTVTALKDIALQAQQSINIQLNALNETKEQKLAKLEEIKRQQDDKAILWDRLQLAIDSSHSETSNYIEDNLNKYQVKVFEDLAFQVDKTNSPKEWLEKDFQFNLRRILENISKVLEKEILQNFSLCQQSLIKEASQQLGTTVETVDFTNYVLGDNLDIQYTGNKPELTDPESCQQIAQVALTDLGRYQQISRVALMGATPLAFMFIGPFAALATGGASWIAGELLKKQVEEQKEIVKTWLKDNLERSFERLQKVIDKYIADGYKKILQNIQSATQKWLDTQQNAYEQACANVNNGAESKPLKELLKQSQQIIREIDVYLNPEQK